MNNKTNTDVLVHAWDKACKDVEKASQPLDINTEVRAGGVTWPPRW